MSLIFATQATAVATVVLAAFAIVTAAFAILAFSKQSSEVEDQASMLQVQQQQLKEQRMINAKQIEVLELQATELHDSTAVRKRAQAAHVFIQQEHRYTLSDRVDIRPESGGTGPLVTATVVNSSEQPIYDVEIRWHLGTSGPGEPDPQPIGTVMPGGEATRTRIFPGDADANINAAVVRFTDASGLRWLRKPDGNLSESAGGLIQGGPHAQLRT